MEGAKAIFDEIQAKNEDLKLVNEGKGFTQEELDEAATCALPTNEFALMRWIGGEKNYENIKKHVATVAQDERATTRHTEPLGPSDVLAAVGQNWTTGSGCHQQVRGGLWFFTCFAGALARTHASHNVL